MVSSVHCALAMWCISPRIASQNARAIEVLPTPGGPTKSQADGYGASANLARIFFGFSSPTNSANECGRYFSDSEAGKANPACLVGRFWNKDISIFLVLGYAHATCAWRWPQIVARVTDFAFKIRRFECICSAHDPRHLVAGIRLDSGNAHVWR